ncbi:MAG: hypothetical protein M3Y08_17705 [Fibrobacterota bacterium]|nr:hypothetical protein [Fibrobacterota bacterium]
MVIGFAVALFAAFQKPFWHIPYHHSYSRGETRYLMILFHHNKLPSYIGRVMIDSVYPSGRRFGKAFIFPALGDSLSSNRQTKYALANMLLGLASGNPPGS